MATSLLFGILVLSIGVRYPNEMPAAAAVIDGALRDHWIGRRMEKSPAQAGGGNLRTAPGSTEVAVIWTVLLAGTMLHLRLTGGAGVIVTVDTVGVDARRLFLISAFDLIVPGLGLWAIVRGWFVWPSRNYFLLAGGTLALVVLHTGYLFFVQPPAHEIWLAKELVKFSAIFVHFVILCGLFGCPALQNPPKSLLMVAIILAGLFALHLTQQPLFRPRTIYLLSIVGMYFLLCDRVYASRGSGPHWSLALVALMVAGLATLMYKKSMAGIAIVLGSWNLIGFWVQRVRLPPSIIVAVIAAITLLAASAAGLLDHQLTRDATMDTIGRSIDVRVALWSLAWDEFLRTFPYGVGLGRFLESISASAYLSGDGHKFAHNTFFSLLAELGLLGVLLAIGLVALIWRTVAGWSSMVLPMYLTVILVPMFLNDAHSVRMLILLVALGFARAEVVRSSKTRT